MWKKGLSCQILRIENDGKNKRFFYYIIYEANARLIRLY